jgi:hypothetical protein
VIHTYILENILKIVDDIGIASDEFLTFQPISLLDKNWFVQLVHVQ